MPKIVHWNPRLRLRDSGVLWRVKRLRRVDNFGDLLGPWIVNRIERKLQLGRQVSRRQRLVTVGSIIGVETKAGDTIWGSGIHADILPLRQPLPQFDVRAVRGRFTAAVLRDSSCPVPEVFGDPALLVPHLWSDSELGIQRSSGGTVLVPNYHDISSAPPNALDPRGDLVERVRTIASASRVIASSLHGVIIAEAYGIPAVLVASSREQAFKYNDYYSGTDRSMPAVAPNWHVARDTPPAPPITNWDPQALIQAFPNDLWQPRS